MGSRPRTKDLVELGSGIRKKKPKRQGWARLRRKRYVNRVRGWRVMGWQNKREGTRVKKPKKMRQSIRSGRLSQQTETLHSRTCKILP